MRLVFLPVRRGLCITLFFGNLCLFYDDGQDTMSKKLAEFKSNDEKLIGMSQRQLSHLCAQLDQRVVHSWQQLKAVELQQSVDLQLPYLGFVIVFAFLF